MNIRLNDAIHIIAVASRCLVRSVIVLLFSFAVSKAQLPDDWIDKKELNIEFLETITREGIDLVRQKHKLPALKNNGILYKAAKLHAEYLVDHKFSHYEPEFPNRKTPQDRVNYFGAKEYYAGENIAMIPTGVIVKGKKIYTYQAAADLLVEEWVNSPGHFKNIVNDTYTHTGMGLVYDRENNKLFAVQVFAMVLSFTESEDTFLFEDKKSKVRKKDPVQKYPFRLKENSKEYINTYKREFSSVKAQLLLDDNMLWLVVLDDSKKMQGLIRKRRDGFALEFVEYTQYRCGNPEYYKRKSRRNDKSFLNGELSKPIYTKQIYRKLAEYHSEAKKGPDRIRYLKKLSKGYMKGMETPPYWYIPLGVLPKMADYMETNLVLIRNRKLTDVKYYYIGSGKSLSPVELTGLKADWPDGRFVIQPSINCLSFQVPFELNKSEIPSEIAREWLTPDSLKNLDIKKIIITSYSSVEGTDSINTDLHINRGKWIKKYLMSHLNNDEGLYDISGTENWNLFAQQIRNSSLQYLFKLNKDSIRTILRNVNNPEIHELLSDQRKATVNVYYENDQLTKDTLMHVFSRWDSLYQVAINSPDIREQKRIIPELEVLQWTMCETKSLPVNDIARRMAAWQFPRREEWARLINNRNWLLSIAGMDTSSGFNKDVIFCGTRKGATDIEKYNYITILLKQELARYHKPSKTVKPIEHLYKTVDWSSFYSKEILTVRTNLNLLLCLYHFPKIKDHKLTAEYYYKLVRDYPCKTMQDTLVLANMHIFMNNSEAAYNMVKKAVDTKSYNKDILKLYLILSYDHYDFPLGVKHIYPYYNLLMKHKAELTPKEWCGLFQDGTRISFQAMDYETLRKTLCETCDDIIINNEF